LTGLGGAGPGPPDGGGRPDDGEIEGHLGLHQRVPSVEPARAQPCPHLGDHPGRPLAGPYLAVDRLARCGQRGEIGCGLGPVPARDGRAQLDADHQYGQ
jgi:hypothetical protein